MNGPAKTLKGLSIAVIVLGVLGILGAGFVLLFGLLSGSIASDPELMRQFEQEWRSQGGNAYDTYSAQDILGMMTGLFGGLGFFMLLAKVFQLIVGIVALRNRENQAKGGLIMGLGIALAVVCFFLGGWISAVLGIAIAVFGHKLRNEGPYGVTGAVYAPMYTQQPQGYADPNAQYGQQQYDQYGQPAQQSYDPNAYAQPQSYDPNAYAQQAQPQAYDPNAQQAGGYNQMMQQGYAEAQAYAQQAPQAYEMPASTVDAGAQAPLAAEAPVATPVDSAMTQTSVIEPAAEAPATGLDFGTDVSEAAGDMADEINAASALDAADADAPENK